MNIQKKTIVVFLLLINMLIINSCTRSYPRWQHISTDHISIPDITINRYEQALFGLDKNNLQNELLNLQKRFPFFLDANLKNSTNINQIYDYLTDPLIKDLFIESMQVFQDITLIEDQINLALKYYRFYLPDEPLPSVYTYISSLDFQHKIIATDSIIIIAIDIYLGPDFKPYHELGVPLYMIKEFDKKYIVRDCFFALGEKYLKMNESGYVLLDLMIYQGKQLYFLDAMLPALADNIKIQYTEEQLLWCQQNEENLWKFIIENGLLYSTDIQIMNKFLNEGPFTRGFPGSPAKLGHWLGWQIVRAYMNNNLDIEFKEMLLNNNAQEILSHSKYKPGR